MKTNVPTRPSGRHFLQIPGPTNVPDRILQAIAAPTIDHRGPEFFQLAKEVVAGMKRVFQTQESVVIYPSSGTGAWEAALSNSLSPGDRVLMFETGHFASLWRAMAARLGLEIDFVPGDWRHGVDPAQVERHSRPTAPIRSKRCASSITKPRPASQAASPRSAPQSTRPGIRLCLWSTRSRHWLQSITGTMNGGSTFTVGGSQKGLMLPPGLGFNAVSKKALAASEKATLARSYWDWRAMGETAETGAFPYTPATNLLFGLREALHMLLDEEGLDAVFRRHARHGEATRRAVAAWGLETLCADPREHSNSLTAIVVPEGHDADRLREIILDGFDMSLGTGLGRVKGKVFRIGHLGWFNDLMLAGTLSGVEMGMHRAGIPHRPGGVTAALDYLAG